MEDGRVEAALFSPNLEILSRGPDRMREKPGYEELISPVRERMMRVIWRVVRHPEEAEDTMQEALAIVWRKRDRIRRHPNPEALILKICVNAAVDALRKQRRGGRFADPGMIDRLQDATAGEERRQREIEKVVREAVGRLPGKQAAAVVMRVLEGYSYREIGEALGCRESTARTHALRGRVKLSRWLSDLRPALPEEVSR